MNFEYTNFELDISEKNIRELYKYKYDIGKIPYMAFKNEIDGLEKVDNRTYKIHIKVGSNTLLLTDKSKLLIKGDNDIANLKRVIIATPSGELTKIVLIKYDVNYGTGSLYLNTDYCKLRTGDIIKLEFTNDINSDDLEIIFLNVLSLLTPIRQL